MIVIISPAKNMKEVRTHQSKHMPIFLERTKELYEELRKYTFTDIQVLMNVNDKLAQLSVQRYQQMKFDELGYCALDAYDGLQYKSMNLNTICEKSWAYLDGHLRILSGFYGMLKPSDSIYPYRLEMQTILSADGCGQLYSFWMDDIANALKEEVKTHLQPYIINLASKEYDRAVRSYFLDETFIDVQFLIYKNGVYKTISTQAKKARGEMVRWIADHACETLEDLLTYDVDDYHYDEQRSTKTSLVFVKN